MSGPRLSVMVAVPHLLVLVVSLFHPDRLSVAAAERWQFLHTVLLLLFPLLALGPWLLSRVIDRRAALVVGVLAYVYATFYTALDVLAGIGGGAVKGAGTGGLGAIFPVAGRFEDIGGLAYVAASALAVGLMTRALGWARVLLPAVLVLAGAVLFWQEHVYHPWGSLAQAALALGWSSAAWQLARHRIRERDTLNPNR